MLYFDSKELIYSEIQRQTGHWINKLWMFMKIKMAGCGWVQLDMAYYVIILMTSNFLTILLRMVSQIIQLSAIQDDFGDIWVGTNRGLVRLNPLSGNIRVFTKVKD